MGKEITEDSYVIYSSNNELTIGKISYCTPKMVVIYKVPVTTPTGKARTPVRKYPKEVMVVGDKELTWRALSKV
jgi:hypothetical protein